MLQFVTLDIPYTFDVLTIDPGVHKCGVSTWLLPGPGDEPARCLSCTTVPTEDVGVLIDQAIITVCEMPRNYKQHAVSWKDVQDLRHVVLGFRQRVRDGGRVWTQYYPSEWKASVPKHIHHARLRALGLVPPPGEHQDHNAWDSFALGCFVFKLVGRGGA